MRQRKFIRGVLVCGLLALFATEGYPQATQHDPLESINVSRSWLISTNWNSGSFGGWNIGTTITGDPQYLMYPGWNNLPSTNAHSNYTRKNGTGVGFGVWVLSREGSQYKLSWSGPRYKSDDIRAMMYDPSKGPESKLGAPTLWERGRGGGFTEPSNWWPGALVPTTGPPRKIWNYSPGKYIADDAFPEELVISRWTNSQGITVTRKVNAWSYQNFDDFTITEYEMENTGDTKGTGVADLPPKTVEDVYIVLSTTFNVSQFGANMASSYFSSMPDRVRDDHFKYTEAGNYVKGGPGGPVFIDPSEAKGLKIAYQFDGKSPFSGYDDTGEPWNTALQGSGLVEMGMVDNQMTSFQFMGIAPVAYADDAGIHSFNKNDKGKYVQPKGAQPAYANRWAIRGFNDYDEPTPAAHSPAQIFSMLTAAPVVDNPTDVGIWTNAQVYGPYTLARGEKAKLVVCYAGGTGAEFKGPGGEPIDHWQWALTASKADVAMGERALVQHVRNALFAYQSGFDLPDSPPDVDLIITSDENARTKLSWSAVGNSAVNPDYTGAEASDIAGYRIYRGQRGNLTSIGPFSLVVDIPVSGALPSGVTYDANAVWPDAVPVPTPLTTPPDRRAAKPGIYTWSDPNSNAGFSYWYSIRSYAKGHSAWTNNDGTKTFADLPARVQTHLKRGLEGGYSNILQVWNGSPVLPITTAANQMQRQIVVTPNPFRLDGTHNYIGDTKIRFLNVPEKAYVYIFNSAGQMIALLRKTDPTRSEVSWNGRPYTSSLVQVGPGIYFYVVKSQTAASEGKIQTGTFVVIR